MNDTAGKYDIDTDTVLYPGGEPFDVAAVGALMAPTAVTPPAAMTAVAARHLVLLDLAVVVSVEEREQLLLPALDLVLGELAVAVRVEAGDQALHRLVEVAHEIEAAELAVGEYFEAELFLALEDS